jgi:hypothetical protein
MEKQTLIEKWTKEMADIKSHIKQHEDTFGHPAVTSRERLEAISDMLADIKQLRQPLVSGQLEAISKDFRLWYYAQSQPLSAIDIESWFASNLR